MDNFARLPAAFDSLRDESIMTVIGHAGDFLGPSVLSTQDRGKGIVQALNKLGVQYVCFGNHEVDQLKPEELNSRIAESNFTWINSNMHGLNTTLPDHVVVSFGDRSIALLGLLTPDPKMYPFNSIGNRTFIEPTANAYQRLYAELEPSVDGVVAFTHQSWADDYVFMDAAKGTRLLAVIGAHDHDAAIDGRCGKGGMDAQYILQTDIVFSEGDVLPTMTHSLVNVLDFPVDEEFQKWVVATEAPVKELVSVIVISLSDYY